MTRCQQCGRPAGFGRTRCSVCAQVGAVDDRPPALQLTIPGAVHRFKHAEPIEVRLTAEGLEADVIELPFGNHQQWAVPYAAITRVAWEHGLRTSTLSVWTAGGLAHQVSGLESSTARAAERLLAKRVSAAGPTSARDAG